MLETLLPFAMASLLIEATPGPNMTYLALLSLAHGRKVGVWAVAGVACGLLVIGMACAFGVMWAEGKYPFLTSAIRYAGVLYMLWLAYDTYKTPINQTVQVHNSTYFWRGFITNLLNPKAAVFFISVLPVFANEAQNSLPHAAIILTVLYVGIATLVHASIVVVAGSFVLENLSAQQEKRVRHIFTAALIGVAVWFWFKTVA